jgi:hypothetical protein
MARRRPAVVDAFKAFEQGAQIGKFIGDRESSGLINEVVTDGYKSGGSAWDITDRMVSTLTEKGRADLIPQALGGESGKQLLDHARRIGEAKLVDAMGPVANVFQTGDYSNPAILEAIPKIGSLIPGVEPGSVTVEDYDTQTGRFNMKGKFGGKVVSTPMDFASLSFRALSSMEDPGVFLDAITKTATAAQEASAKSKAKREESEQEFRQKVGLEGYKQKARAAAQQYIIGAEGEKEQGLIRERGKQQINLQKARAGSRSPPRARLERATREDGSEVVINLDTQEVTPVTTQGMPPGAEGTPSLIARPDLAATPLPLRLQQKQPGSASLPRGQQKTSIFGIQTTQGIVDNSKIEAAETMEPLKEVILRNTRIAMGESGLQGIPKAPQSASPALPQAQSIGKPQGGGRPIRDPATGKKAFRYNDGRVVDLETGERLR